MCPEDGCLPLNRHVVKRTRASKRHRLTSTAQAVFLVGFMGAGKTSVGEALAAQLGWRFIDLDQRIEARAQKRIAEIFRSSGESAFRHAEKEELLQVLAELETAGGAVVALGGGAFVQPDNGSLLAECGAPCVFLDAPVEELWRRAQAAQGERPLAVSENQFRQLYAARRQRYMEAACCVQTVGRAVAEVAAEIAASLQLGTGKGEWR